MSRKCAETRNRCWLRFIYRFNCKSCLIKRALSGYKRKFSKNHDFGRCSFFFAPPVYWACRLAYDKNVATWYSPWEWNNSDLFQVCTKWHGGSPRWKGIQRAPSLHLGFGFSEFFCSSILRTAQNVLFKLSTNLERGQAAASFRSRWWPGHPIRPLPKTVN